jgi:3-hydroxyacyl-CoA dehydrogenase
MSADQMQQKMELAEFTLTYDGFDDVDIVIEGVPEKMAIKKQVFAELDEICHPEAIFVSNTSALSIAAMGAATRRAEQVAGMHFFSPAHIMKLVEVVHSPTTSQETVDTVEQFTQELRKIAVIVKECPGFLVNRLLMVYLNEAVLALQEGAATVAEIDAALGRGGFGWPMGPFMLMDMVGNDVCYHVGRYLASQYSERMAAAVLFEAMAENGRFGEKARAGWYDYPGGGESEVVKTLIADLQAAGKTATGTEFCVDRLMMPMLNEAFRCAEEEIANINDIDMACIAGLGMQVNLGGDLVRMGPLEYADELGLDSVLTTLEQLQNQFGNRFQPAALLQQKVNAGELGKKARRGFREYTV